MLYKNNLNDDLNMEFFKNPTSEYRGTPFWAWNCKVTEELIDQQVEYFYKMGFGGVHIHPRTGMDTPYLSEEYMHLIQYSLKKLQEKNMLCWLYDEDRYPSGIAGGIVTKNIRLRARSLLLTENYPREDDENKVSENPYLLAGFCKDNVEFENAINQGKKPLGYYVTAYEVNLEDGYLKKYHRLETFEDIEVAITAGKKVRFVYVKLLEENPRFNDQTYLDTLNPEAVLEFIKVTHEAYYEAVGDEFGKSVPAIFTDEARITGKGILSDPYSDEDVSMAFSEKILEPFHEKYSISFWEILPQLLWELPAGEVSIWRYDYHDFIAECFVKNFPDQISEWCSEHNLAMTGHYLSEESLFGQTTSLGECMRCYRKMELPGIDILCDFKELSTVKQAVSVARQYGREGVASELYGVTHWDCDFKTLKVQGDWQAALGITIRVPHLSFMSMEGEGKRDWPASIFYQSPWFKEYPYIEDHFARLNAVLTRGKAKVSIAVIHPIESFWLSFGPNSQTQVRRDEMERNYKELIEWLLYGNLDFDFISEALLPELCKSAGNPLNVGEMQYTTVIVPGLTTMRNTTLQILEDFAAAGGNVIFLDKIPLLVDVKESDRVQMLAKQSQCILKNKDLLYQALESERVVEIRNKNGKMIENLFYQMREDKNCRWLFLSRVNQRRNKLSAPEQIKVKIKGSYFVTLYDTLTGETASIPFIHDESNTYFVYDMYAQDSLLLRLDEDEVAKERGNVVTMMNENRNTNNVIAKLQEPDYYNREEPNALLLDYAMYKLDDGEIQTKEEILRLDNQIRENVGFPLREEYYTQPWCIDENDADSHIVTLYYEFNSEIETKAMLALEAPEKSKIWLNGKPVDMNIVGYYVDSFIKTINLPLIAIGKNELIMEVRYNRKGNLENLFVLGDFSVELNGTKAVIRKKQEKITCGDITRQGMPFYSGNLNYHFNFFADGSLGSYFVRVPHFASPVLAVYVDGRKIGLIAYAPHRLELGNLEEGTHEIMICSYGNRFNGFGTLHNANDEFIWYGPNSFRTSGDDWSDSYGLHPSGILSAIEIEQENERGK